MSLEDSVAVVLLGICGSKLLIDLEIDWMLVRSRDVGCSWQLKAYEEKSASARGAERRSDVISGIGFLPWAMENWTKPSSDQTASKTEPTACKNLILELLRERLNCSIEQIAGWSNGCDLQDCRRMRVVLYEVCTCRERRGRD